MTKNWPYLNLQSHLSCELLRHKMLFSALLLSIMPKQNPSLTIPWDAPPQKMRIVCPVCRIWLVCLVCLVRLVGPLCPVLRLVGGHTDMMHVSMSRAPLKTTRATSYTLQVLYHMCMATGQPRSQRLCLPFTTSNVHGSALGGWSVESSAPGFRFVSDPAK